VVAREARDHRNHERPISRPR